MAAYLRTCWNGWTTERRFRTCTNQPLNRCCKLGCAQGDDSIEHYSLCGIFWSFVCNPRPGGLGVSQRFKSREAFFLLHSDLTDEDKVRLALGMYALHKAVMHNKFREQVADVKSMLFLWTRRAADFSKAKRLLMY
jgi:hypothetical protein